MSGGHKRFERIIDITETQLVMSVPRYLVNLNLRTVTYLQCVCMCPTTVTADSNLLHFRDLRAKNEYGTRNEISNSHDVQCDEETSSGILLR